MKKRNVIFCTVIAAALMISCGSAKEADSKITDLQSSAVGTETAGTETAGSEESTAVPGSTAAGQSSETAESTADKSTKQETETPKVQAQTESSSAGDLDQLALSSLTNLLNQNAYNGFLCSSYSDVRHANLYQIFYNGAGMDDQVKSDAEKQDYLKQTGSSELMTDFLKLTTDQMSTFLQKTTGYTFQNFKDAGNITMSWVYLKQYDAYYAEIGDTNLQMIKLLDGKKLADGTYEVHLMEDTNQDGEKEKGTLKFQLQGSLQDLEQGSKEIPIRFISNQTEEETAQDQAVIPMNDQIVAGFKTDADTSVIDPYMQKYTKKGDYSDILSDPSRFYGLWYDPEMKETIYLTDKTSQVYITWLGNYGEKNYKWKIIDRSAKKLSPELAVYINGEDKGPLAYYLGGVTDNLFWNYDKSQIFYRQTVPAPQK